MSSMVVKIITCDSTKNPSSLVI